MENCPHCKAEVDCDSAWRNSDHQSQFRYVCPTCDGIMEIIVEQCPVFETDFVHCDKCNKVIDGTRYYCDECQAELNALKEHNKRRGP
jgi:hypothetical protein